MKIETEERCNSQQKVGSMEGTEQIVTWRPHIFDLFMLCRVCDVHGLRVMNFLGIQLDYLIISFYPI